VIVSSVYFSDRVNSSLETLTTKRRIF